MIDFTSVRAAIETLISTEITDAYIVFENTTVAPVNTEHLEVLDTTSTSSKMGLSDDISRVHGVLTVFILTEAGTGTERAKVLASLLSTMYANAEINGLSFETSELYSAGYNKSGTLYQHNLETPYSYFYGQDDSNTC